MQFSTKVAAGDRIRTACLVVPVRGGQADAATRLLDAAARRRVEAAIASGDLADKAGATLLVALDDERLPRVLLVSFGDGKPVAARTFLEATRAAIRHVAGTGADDAASLLHEVEVTGRALGWKIRSQVLIGAESAYRFDSLKSRKDEGKDKGPRPSRWTMLVGRDEDREAGLEAERAAAIADGMALAKDLGNLPGNICTPTYLADTARRIAREHKLKCDVLDEKQMRALKMGSLLAVARGSEQPPKLIVLHYKGAGARQAPVVLVGKGITFDTGGISLKPGAEMDEMKYDMCGAASVLGTVQAVAALGLRVNLIGVVPTCENMPSGRATRPGDIVTSMSGQTIEILNTDAEGRLILCDALTYVERFKPAAVVDIATLTGACVIALGHHNSGLFSGDDDLAAELLAAGREMNDPCWRMPLDDEYQDLIKSPFADMANIGGRAAGSVTAACFLARYTKAYRWAHLDIAGTAWKSGANKGATGRPVPLLTRFVAGHAK